MPVADTQLLFGLNPADRHHRAVMEVINRTPLLVVPDTAVLEFTSVLRARGSPLQDVSDACGALMAILLENRVAEARTLGIGMLMDAAGLECGSGLSYFDAMIAASARSVDSVVVSDDDAFDRVPGLERIPITPARKRKSSRPVPSGSD